LARSLCYSHFMKLLDILAQRVLILDGGMGTEIFQRSGRAVEIPEILNINEQAHIIQEIHRSYIDAGADIIETNTLGANRIKLMEFGLADRVTEINQAASRLAREARGELPDVFIAGSIGPTGKLLYPMGDLQVEDAYAVFVEQARALENAGVDFLLIETQIDIHEAKTALRAARDATSLPVAVSMTFPQQDDRTVTGSDPDTAAVVFATPDTDLYGINCGGHPEKVARILERTLLHNRKPLAVYANAGEPQKQGETTVFPLGPEEFLPYAHKFYELGAHIIGGCCGTTPEHIRLIAKELKGKNPSPKQAPSAGFRAAGRTVLIHLGGTAPFRIIGENINPFARKALAEELEEERMDLARSYARRQERAGAHALDINLGKRAEKEPFFFASGVAELQRVSNLPFFLDNRSPDALEAALKLYAGKAVINSVTAEKQSRDSLLPLAKKYGAGVILLAMDDEGIPGTAKARFDLLKGLYDQALALGLNPGDLLVDPVVMSLASAPEKVFITLDTIELLSSFRIATTLGLSNISYGLPQRRLLNSSFLCMARQRGLDSAILNPLDKRLVSVICAGDALTAKDPGLKRYLDVFGDSPEDLEEEAEPQPADAEGGLFKAILEGEKERVKPLVKHLLSLGKDGFSILNDILSPALEKAGEYYEKNLYFLPQLILAAEAMEAASPLLEGAYDIGEKAGQKARIVLATVKGDLHDIGKNIVNLVLRNSGFEVFDLGKNVAAQDILDTAQKENAEVIGLSSLMTTTLDEMERIIRLRNQQAPNLAIIVGGAAVSPSYAREIGADAYGKDALDAVRQVKNLLKEKP
jgi:5-methyltetrahydrofolate--homocysteine methyltransferase